MPENPQIQMWMLDDQKDRLADVPGAVKARNAVWGFHPVYFEPDSVKKAIQIILHDEWKIPRK